MEYRIKMLPEESCQCQPKNAGVPVSCSEACGSTKSSGGSCWLTGASCGGTGCPVDAATGEITCPPAGTGGGGGVLRSIPGPCNCGRCSRDWTSVWSFVLERYLACSNIAAMKTGSTVVAPLTAYCDSGTWWWIERSWVSGGGAAAGGKSSSTEVVKDSMLIVAWEGSSWNILYPPAMSILITMVAW